MDSSNSVIETGVDKLVTLVNKSGKISSTDAAKELGVSSSIVMEWAEFLEEEGIISIEYKLTSAYLVARKIPKKEVHLKEKEYASRKDVFVKKAEVSLGFLEKEASKLNSIKEEFDKIKKDLGLDIGNIKDELEDLKQYESMKIELDKEIEEQRTTSMDKIHALSKEITRERMKYSDLIKEIEKEESQLNQELKDVKTLEGTEDVLEQKIIVLRKTIEEIAIKTKNDRENAKTHEQNIKRFNELAERVKKHVNEEFKSIEPLIAKSNSQEAKIKELQEKVVKKLSENEKRFQGVQQASSRIKGLFKEKMEVLNLIENINRERNELRNDLTELIKKARSFQITSKSAHMEEEIADLQKKFEEVDKKKSFFEKELKKLGKYFS